MKTDLGDIALGVLGLVLGLGLDLAHMVLVIEDEMRYRSRMITRPKRDLGDDRIAVHRCLGHVVI